MKKALLAAAALATLSGSALAIDIPLPNGGFDVGAPASNTYGLISNWTVQSVPTSGFASGVFTSYAGYVPNNGSRMAIITNGGGTTFMQIRNVVPIELFRMPYFNFSFAFLTTDALNTAVANRDNFRVVIDYFSDAAGLNQIGTQSYLVNTGTLIARSTPVSGSQIGPWANGTLLNGTQNDLPGGPNALSLAVLPISLTSAPYANFTFYLDNLGTTANVTSGVLIDNVYINPEPGTMALFGLGAAGLAGLVLRRRKAAAAKKAAEAAVS